MASKWFNPRALLLHVTLVGWLGGCAAAAYWQVTRAAEGNALSYLYAIEWPVFGIAGIVGWYALINIEKVTEAQEQARRDYEEKMRAEAQAARASDAESPELAAYNDHLAALAKEPRRKLFGH
ncbi:MAG: hypothetical protein KJS64_02285 [Acidobacteria bacterium]|nr:hypothetical protein [Acidobacteriota bacterium]